MTAAGQPRCAHEKHTDSGGQRSGWDGTGWQPCGAWPARPGPQVPSYWRDDAPDTTAEQHREHADRINALRTRIGEDGRLSNLVWNVRNRYLADPDGTFTAVEVRVLVEGFLAELAAADA